jgi:hypothetical protein
VLKLARTADYFPDDTVQGVRYRLPASLTPTAGADGIPQAVLTRGADGGLLHLRLGAAWPAFAPGDRPVSFDSARFRLRLQTPTASENGDWRPSPIAGEALVERSVSLTPVEFAIARHLGERTGDLVNVEVELSIRGALATFPWLVSATSAALRPRITALIGSAPVAWDAVEAAFLGLADDTFTWYPLATGAVRPLLDQALRAIARAVAPTLLSQTQAGWVVADDVPPRLDVNLMVPGTGTEWVGYRWSFSEFLAAQSDPGKHLVDLAVPAPFEAADVSIVNDLPLAPSGIRSIAVDVRTGGPTGLVRHEFLAGQQSAARLRFVRETFDDLKLQWSARYTVMTAGGPAVETTDFRPSSQLIELNSATLKLTALRFAAEPVVFEHLASLEIGVGTRTITLTRASPDAWAITRQAPATAAVSAVLASGERLSLGTMPVGARGIAFDASILGIGEFARVALRPPADLAQRAAYLAVQAEGGAWRTVDPGAEVVIPVQRQSRLQPARLRYRIRHVARDSSGATRPMTESAWRDATGDIVAVEL